MVQKKIVQAVLAICGLSNGGFDYSRTEKVAKSVNNKEKRLFLAYIIQA